MEQDVLDRYSISQEGVVLSSLILSYINDEFSTNLPETESIVNSSSVSEEVYTCLDSLDRGDGVKTNLCIQQGIIDYITYYTVVNLQSNGVSTAIPPNTMDIVVDDVYGLKHSGIVSVNEDMNELFTMFSLGRLMGKLDVDSDYMEELFKDIVYWLGFNLSPSKANKLNNINIDSYGFVKETYINGKGTVLFKDKRSDIRDHISNINDRLSILNTDNIDQFNIDGKWLVYFFEATWGIICTSIVEFLNNNTVTTDDTGYSFYGNGAMSYEGVSTSSVVFGYEYQQPTELVVVEILGVSIKVSFKITIPDINIVIPMKDFNGNEKEFVINISISGISLDASDMPNVMEVLNKKLDDITKELQDSVAERSNRLGRTYDQISDDVDQVTKKMTDVVNSISSAITKKLNEVIESLKILLKSMSVRSARDIVWDPLLNNPDPKISGPANIYYTAKEKVNAAVSKVNGAIEKISNSEKIVENIKDINEAIGEYNNAIEEVDRVIEELGPDFCLYVPVPTIPQLMPIPDIPSFTLDPIPEVPTGPFPKVPSDDIEFTDDGDLEGEVPIVSTIVDGVVDAIVPTVEIPELNPPQGVLPEVVRFSYPPTTSPDVGYNNEKYNDVSVYSTSESMKNDIKSNESLLLELTMDHDKKHAILGYGHVVGIWDNRSSLQQRTTRQEADMWFNEDIKISEDVVKRFVRQNITQGQFDSFVDLVYNAGGGRFRDSTILSWFNQGRLCDTSNLYRRCFITGGGVVLGGLIRRRDNGYTYFIRNWGVSGCVPY